MKKYVSPVVLENADLAEGVFAAGSGSAALITLTYQKTVGADWNEKQYYYTATAADSIVGTKGTYTATIDQDGTNAWSNDFNGNVSVSGRIVTFANTSDSGIPATFEVVICSTAAQHPNQV